VNAEPAPGVDSTRSSPPSRRAISREIDRPSPVPPYLRDVVPSACWKASKISDSLSWGMPTPVSMTEKATLPLSSGPMCSVTEPSWVN
jgi:hypothetical protein